MKIAVYTITKNEEHFIRRWAESCKEADCRLIVDTGSTDNTVQVALEAGCSVASISVSPWRFDDARNAAMALLPPDIDWCVSLDADEVLQPGWRQHLEALPSHVTRPRYKYVWSWNPDGTEGLVFYRDHIHRRHSYRWKHPVHEILECVATETQAVCGLEVHHHPDPLKSRSQYLPLLELAVKEDPTGDRNLFYLGRELIFNNRLDEATPYLLRHLEISKWDAERAASMRYLAKTTGDRETWLLRSCAEAPNRREGWVSLANFYYEKQDWASCYSTASRALEIVDKPLDYICEADAWGSLPHDLCSIAAWHMGKKLEAFKHATQAFDFSHLDNRLLQNAITIARSISHDTVDVVIPTKSNYSGLHAVLELATKDPAVRTIFVVIDGPQHLGNVEQICSEYRSKNYGSINADLKLIVVPEESGIHVMWNAALEQKHSDTHMCFINDDVKFDPHAVSVLSAQLISEQTYGLISPNYDNRLIAKSGVRVRGATGVYGKSGISGAFMMLSCDLAAQWRFDTTMKWYFGDDDVARWTRETKGREAVISGLVRSWGNESWTTVNNPPKNFARLTELDKQIFDTKWAANASRSS